jgi:hypothetical protein
MNRQHSYLLVEGPQDVFFIGRILQELGLRDVKRADDVPNRWKPFIDQAVSQRDRAERASGRSGLPIWQMFKQACLLSDTHVVVIEQVGGNRSKFGNTLRATSALIDDGLEGLHGVGLITDADANPKASFLSSVQALMNSALQPPNSIGEVATGSPSTGIFVMPSAIAQGGLEELLIECAEVAYPNLTKSAKQYVATVDVNDAAYTEDDMKEMKSPQGQVKAVVGAISSVLKSGSTIQVSLLRDRWISPETLATPGVASLVQFLKSLCGIP